MKKILLAIIPFVLLYSCNTEPQYKIIVKHKILGSGMAYLKDRNNVVDLVKYSNGEIIFKGNIEMPELRTIEYADTMSSIPVFLDNNEIIVEVVNNSEPLIYSGGVANKKYQDIVTELKEIGEELNVAYKQVSDAKKIKDEKGVSEAEKKIENLYKDYDDALRNFISQNNNSAVAGYLAQRMLVYKFTSHQLDSILQTFDPSIKSSKYVVEMSDFLKKYRSLDVGNPYVEATLDDVYGKTTELSSFIGKNYVLIDFWASWCNPCREENPYLLENYVKYHDKGFEICGITMDQNKNAWLKAIEKDGIIWPQYFDNFGTEKAISELYAIRFIPQNLLIDKNGIIIAKNLKGEKLGFKLKELLENSMYPRIVIRNITH